MIGLFRRKRLASVTPEVAWDRALAHADRTRQTWFIHLERQIAYELAHPGLDDEQDRLQEIAGEWCHRDAEAIRALIEVPAPSLAEALVKLELAIYHEEDTDAALADLRRLTGLQRPSLPVLELR